jgi:hypothetical protein
MTGTIVSLPPIAPRSVTSFAGPYSLTIGAVTTLAPGSSATAVLTGTYGSQVLSLGIPRGATSSGVDSLAGRTGTITAAQLWSDLIASLPTTNPHVVGLPWWNGESLSISQG